MSSSRSHDDTCAIKQELKYYTDPYYHVMYIGKHENCNRCTLPNLKRRIPLVDIESELKNITRMRSKCNNYKYHPLCKSSKKKPVGCISTFNPMANQEVSPTLCRIVNIYNMYRPSSGIRPIDVRICNKNLWNRSDINMLQRRVIY